jgi:hypothetical protein
MTACETCWGDAYARARMLGGAQVEHYHALLTERDGDGLHETRPTTTEPEGSER